MVCQDAAPAGAARATVTLAGMLPTGRLRLDRLKLAQVLSPAETFASETPLVARTAEHPRAFLSPSEAENLPHWVSDTRETPFGASRAGLFKSIRDRALALIHIAHPDFREELMRAARDLLATYSSTALVTRRSVTSPVR
jgi:hypothetical protein